MSTGTVPSPFNGPPSDDKAATYTECSLRFLTGPRRCRRGDRCHSTERLLCVTRTTQLSAWDGGLPSLDEAPAAHEKYAAPLDGELRSLLRPRSFARRRLQYLHRPGRELRPGRLPLDTARPGRR